MLRRLSSSIANGFTARSEKLEFDNISHIPLNVACYDQYKIDKARRFRKALGGVS